MKRAKRNTKSKRKRTGRTDLLVTETKRIRTKPIVEIREPATLAKTDLLVTETKRIRTEPKVEIRKPATLAQALTEPAVAVVKPETKVKVLRRTTRRAA